MTEIGAKVWRLAMNSAVQGPTDENGCGEWLHSGEFVRLQDYDIALKLIVERDMEKKLTEDDVRRIAQQEITKHQRYLDSDLRRDLKGEQDNVRQIFREELYKYELKLNLWSFRQGIDGNFNRHDAIRKFLDATLLDTESDSEEPAASASSPKSGDAVD